jgi:organic hydroperoxide reductase OsmC/OhrA
MLFFLAIAATRDFVVDEYRDEAVGEMGKTAEGRMAMTRVVLRPTVRFAGGRLPAAEEFQAMHRLANEQCYIANSVRTEVVCEPIIER